VKKCAAAAEKAVCLGSENQAMQDLQICLLLTTPAAAAFAHLL
jgi:hypothetical protein